MRQQEKKRKGKGKEKGKKRQVKKGGKKEICRRRKAYSSWLKKPKRKRERERGLGRVLGLLYWTIL
jgi:hypothetical protein